MKIVAARFIPETVQECADLLAMHAVRSYQWTDEMVEMANRWTDAYRAEHPHMDDDGDDMAYPELLQIEDVRTLALAYALARP